MFSEHHHQILQAIAPGFSDTQAVADKIGLPAALTTHLLEELSQCGFIKTARSYRSSGQLEVAGACLENKGRAAVASPEHFLGKPMTTDKGNTWNGDRIAGDKVAGDKVMGNKVQIGTVQGDAVAGNKIVNSQNLAQAAQDIKALLDQLAIAHPTDDDFTQAGRAVGAIQSNPTLKQRLINAAKESGTAAVEKAIAAVVDNPAVSIIVAGVKGFCE
jgi:hypothetical protein